MFDNLMMYMEGRWVAFGILIAIFATVAILSQVNARKAKKKQQEKLSSTENTD